MREEIEGCGKPANAELLRANRREEIRQRFGPYRKPTEATIPKFKAIQEKSLELALLIDELCPESREKATALTNLVGVKMYANAAIAVYSKVE